MEKCMNCEEGGGGEGVQFDHIGATPSSRHDMQPWLS
jgi:hypothetical protein